MLEYKLTDKDFKTISSNATEKFIQNAVQYKELYGTFVTRCVVEAFLEFISFKNLQIKNDKIYYNEL